MSDPKANESQLKSSSNKCNEPTKTNNFTLKKLVIWNKLHQKWNVCCRKPSIIVDDSPNDSYDIQIFDKNKTLIYNHSLPKHLNQVGFDKNNEKMYCKWHVQFDKVQQMCIIIAIYFKEKSLYTSFIDLMQASSSQDQGQTTTKPSSTPSKASTKEEKPSKPSKTSVTNPTNTQSSTPASQQRQPAEQPMDEKMDISQNQYYLYKEASIRNKWKEGSPLEIYSESKGKWIDGKIHRIFDDAEGEWLEVRYDGSMKAVQRFNECVRPPQSARRISDLKEIKQTASPIQSPTLPATATESNDADDQSSLATATTLTESFATKHTKISTIHEKKEEIMESTNDAQTEQGIIPKPMPILTNSTKTNDGTNNQSIQPQIQTQSTSILTSTTAANDDGNSDDKKEKIVESQNVTKCPHGDMSLAELGDIKIRNRKVCSVRGLPSFATEKLLVTNKWYGQFKGMTKIKISRENKHKSLKNTTIDSITAFLTFDDEKTTTNAIAWSNAAIFNDGRRLKAAHGIQYYCRSFLAGNTCELPHCRYQHEWVKDKRDIITDDEIDVFNAKDCGLSLYGNVGITKNMNALNTPTGRNTMSPMTPITPLMNVVNTPVPNPMINNTQMAAQYQQQQAAQYRQQQQQIKAQRQPVYIYVNADKYQQLVNENARLNQVIHDLKQINQKLRDSYQSLKNNKYAKSDVFRHPDDIVNNINNDAWMNPNDDDDEDNKNDDNNNDGSGSMDLSNYENWNSQQVATWFGSLGVSIGQEQIDKNAGSLQIDGSDLRTVNQNKLDALFRKPEDLKIVIANIRKIRKCYMCHTGDRQWVMVPCGCLALCNKCKDICNNCKDNTQKTCKACNNKYIHVMQLC